ncbi:CYTH domain-containing protein [candidate division KSB1 bacterium]|nr:CYTH domain-containing protein [candidate division KSB1 bacterium]
MEILNIEIKARCRNLNEIQTLLLESGADFKGTDHQIDTYFKVNHGRLKLREGTIERSLIFYNRENSADPKASKVILLNNPDSSMKKLLTAALGVQVVVDKTREIYFIENVKFHLDNVKNLGYFVEIEAIDKDGTIGREVLQRQCESYMKKFRIQPSDLLPDSYSDMLVGLTE